MWIVSSGGTAPRAATGSARPTRARDHHNPPGPGFRIGHRDARRVWIGPDDRGIELEIVALDLDDAIVVIHVLPASLRR